MHWDNSQYPVPFLCGFHTPHVQPEFSYPIESSDPLYYGFQLISSFFAGSFSSLCRLLTHTMILKLLLFSVFLSVWVSACEGLQRPLPSDYENAIYVDPASPNSTNSSLCYTSAEKHPCADINFALAFPGRRYSTLFVLSSSNIHYLADSVSNNLFRDSTHIAFYGPDNNGTAIVNCMKDAGVAFVGSSGITIYGVTFRYCGTWRNSTSEDFRSPIFKLKSFRVSIYFYNCRNIQIECAKVLNSTNALGVVMFSTVGVNYIANSNFDFNGISWNNSIDSGGGGFAVEFNYCKPGDDKCDSDNHQIENISHSLYSFENCTFNNNRGVDQSSGNGGGLFILAMNKTHSSLGRGGGLSVYFKGVAKNNTIVINNCEFRHNHANWGGGLLVEFNDVTVQNKVNVHQTYFFKNHCYFKIAGKGASGGGVRVESSVFYASQFYPTFSRNSISFQDCSFNKNRALTGGAISLSYHRQQFSLSEQLFHVNLLNCSFTFNSARLGSAVSVEHEHFYSKGQIGEAFFKDCEFYNNTIVYENQTDSYSVGIGAVYISEVTVSYQGNVNFEGNNGTALAIVGTTVYFLENSVIVFKNNRGSNGGAMSFLGAAGAVLSHNTEFLFFDNFAKLYGGAVYNNYIGKEDLRSSIKCFLQYSDSFANPEKWKTKFTFSKNVAGKLGQSIFSSTILPCSWSENVEADLDIAKEIFCWNASIWIYENSSCKEQIRTSPKTFDLSNAKSGDIYPGHQFHVHIRTLDDLNNDVTKETIFTGAISNNVSAAEVDPKYAYIADGYIGITGEENQTLTLELNVANTREWHVELNLTMGKCPVGFKAQNMNGNDSLTANLAKTVCTCIKEDAYSFQGNLLCNALHLMSYIRNGFWIGHIPAVSNDFLVMASTIRLYRNETNDFFPLPRKLERLDYNQCSHLHSTGPLCGECVENYSIAVNSYSYECVQCNTTDLSVNIAYYISLTYVPYLVIFVLIIFLDIRLMSGPAVGFILYAQLVGSGVFDFNIGAVTFSKHAKDLQYVQNAYRTVFGLFNLNSFSFLLHPFCVSKTFSALDVLCLDLAVGAFPLILIVVIYILMPLKSIKLKRDSAIRRVRQTSKLGTTLVHSFVGFIYLSYTKFALASTKLLSTTGLLRSDGSSVPDIKLVYYAGQYVFGQKEYMLPYGVVAIIVFVIFAVLLPVLLMGPFQLMNWLADKPCFQFLNKYWPTLRINIFLDAFQGCYKPNRRYFTGVYFIFRLVIFITYALTASELSDMIWKQILCTLMLVIVAILQPYRVNFINYLDILLFLNLSIINAVTISLYSSYTANAHGSYSFSLYLLCVALIWLPLVFILLYVCWHQLKRSRIYRHCIRSIRPFAQYEENERQPLLSPVVAGTLKSDSDYDPLSDASLFSRAEETNRYRPSSRNIISVDTNDSTNGTASVYGTNGTTSSGIVTDGSKNSEHSNNY